MKELVAAAIFFLVTLAVFSRSASPGEPFTHRLGAELRLIARVR
jgi:hypothetical protein